MALEVWVDNKNGVKCTAKHPLGRKSECIALNLSPSWQNLNLIVLRANSEYPAEHSPVSQQWRMEPFSLSAAQEDQLRICIWIKLICLALSDI